MQRRMDGVRRGGASFFRDDSPSAFYNTAAENHFDFFGGAGDGWVQARGYVMNVTNASESFATALHDILEAQGFNGRINEPTKHSSAYRVWVSGKHDVINLADWIYEDAGDLYLERKRERFYVNCEREKAS